MRNVRTAGAFGFLMCLAVAARAQTFPNLAIQAEGMTIGTSGGEKGNVTFSTAGLVIGETTTGTFSKMPNQCGFSVRRGPVDPAAVTGWTVAVTPRGLAGDAVTFRLEWARVRDEGKDVSGPRGDLVVTLRPGQSMPVDMAPLSPAVTMPYEQCKVRATSIRVGVTAWPRPQEDRRLMATELWLVERLPNGTERSQLLSLRGLLHQPMPFYFDSVRDGDASLDLFGEFTVMISPFNGSVTMALETRSRLVQGTRKSMTISASPSAPGLFAARSVQSTIPLNANDIVAVDLPRLSENDTGAFANHAFSIRIRSRQVR